MRAETKLILQSALLPTLAWKELAERREDYGEYGDGGLSDGAVVAVVVLGILVVALFVWSVVVALRWYRCGIVGGWVLATFLFLSLLGFWPIGLLILVIAAAGKGPGAVAPPARGSNCSPYRMRPL